MEANSINAYDLPDRVESYDADMELMHPNRSKMVEIALEVLPFKEGSDITAMDIGIGTGYFTECFLKKFPKAMVIGIDGAKAMLDLAGARLRALVDKVDFRIGDFRQLSQLVSNQEKLRVF